MKLCFSGSQVDTPTLNPNSSVDEAIRVISQSIDTQAQSVALIYKGQILTIPKLLGDYGIDDNSIIHVILTARKKRKSCDMSHRLYSLDECEEPLLGGDNLQWKEELDEGRTIISSFFVHIFGDVVQRSKKKEPVHVSLMEIKKTVKSDPSILSTAVQTPLFQDIISDLTFVRKLLLSNSLMKQMMQTNSRLQSFIENDDQLQDLVHILSNSNNYADLHLFKEMILQKVESGIGHKLEFGNSINTAVNAMNINDSFSIPFHAIDDDDELNPWSIQSEEKSSRHCRDDHIALLCQLIANKPKIAASFMKHTPMYKYLSSNKPELLKEVLKPERLKLMARPEMIKALIKFDKVLSAIVRKKK